MVADLTGLPMTNSSLLDEGTAAAEAMTMSYNADRKKRQQYFVSDSLHPQTKAVLKTRAEPLSIQLVFGAPEDIELGSGAFFGAILQYPNTFGDIEDYAEFCARAHEHNCLVTVACDLLALTLLTPPGEFGADIAVGNSQRFGVPLGGGGPHAGFFATKEHYRRQMPGRIIGVSKDADGRPCIRLTLQTREQHIRRDKATSNICTAQVLLAVMAGMYAVYHGAEGLKSIALRVFGLTSILRARLESAGIKVLNIRHFDTLTLEVDNANEILGKARDRRINFRQIDERRVGLSLDETTTVTDVLNALGAFGVETQEIDLNQPVVVPSDFRRTSDFMTHEVFQRYRSEHEMLRYLYRLQQRDLSLTTSMIPLGSCTMKLNSTSEMLPVTWLSSPIFTLLHQWLKGLVIWRSVLNSR